MVSYEGKYFLSRSLKLYFMVCVLICILFFVTPWTVTCWAPLCMEFSRQEHWSGLPCPPPEDHPNLGTELTCPVAPALAGGCFTTVLSLCPSQSFALTYLPHPPHFSLFIWHFVSFSLSAWLFYSLSSSRSLTVPSILTSSLSFSCLLSLWNRSHSLLNYAWDFVFVFVFLPSLIPIWLTAHRRE